MRYYPVLLNLKNKKCVVIGGGIVALRKALSLLKAGARVYLISPELCPGLKRLKEQKSSPGQTPPIKRFI